MGTGAFANLIRFRKPEDVDAIVISHMHADHFIDLIVLRYALRYGARSNGRRIALYLPPGGARILRGVVEPFAGEAGAFLDDVYSVAEYDPAATLEIGDASVAFVETKHYIACYAMRFSFAGTTFVYSADTGPSDDVAAFARGAKILLCEATLSPEEEEASQPRGHLSSREAGALARDAGARTLLLSHYPHSADVESMVREAAGAFDGNVRVVDDAERIVFSDF